MLHQSGPTRPCERCSRQGLRCRFEVIPTSGPARQTPEDEEVITLYDPYRPNSPTNPHPTNPIPRYSVSQLSSNQGGTYTTHSSGRGNQQTPNSLPGAPSQSQTMNRGYQNEYGRTSNQHGHSHSPHPGSYSMQRPTNFQTTNMDPLSRGYTATPVAPLRLPFVIFFLSRVGFRCQ